MKNGIIYLVLLFLSFLISCDTTKFPIDAHPQIKINKNYFGTWKIKNKKDKDTYIVIKRDDYNYLILIKHSKEQKPDSMNAFVSKINDILFLNINNISDTTEGYFFGKIIDINKNNNKIKYSLVKDSTLKYLKNPDEIRQRIKENINNPTFYSDTAYFKKISIILISISHFLYAV